MGHNAIEIEGLTKTYAPSKGQPAKHALKGIDLEIPHLLVSKVTERLELARTAQEVDGIKVVQAQAAY